jgi:hypothetical protein
MSEIEAGDLVRIADSDYEMLIIGCADDDTEARDFAPSWFCVWEYEHRLYEEVFSEDSLILVRKERRRIPRGGDLTFPCNESERPRYGARGA